MEANKESKLRAYLKELKVQADAEFAKALGMPQNDLVEKYEKLSAMNMATMKLQIMNEINSIIL